MYERDDGGMKGEEKERKRMKNKGTKEITHVELQLALLQSSRIYDHV
jgi:hypothetical protein